MNHKENLVAAMLTDMEELQAELDYLRWFHQHISIAMIKLMQSAYADDYGVVPQRWRLNREGNEDAQT